MVGFNPKKREAKAEDREEDGDADDDKKAKVKQPKKANIVKKEKSVSVKS